MASDRPSSPLRSWLMFVTIAGSALAALNCHGSELDDLSSDRCRLEPARCDGGAGARCDGNRDCADPLFCCDDGNCGGGMCTLECRSDGDCPVDMLCEHDLCFYACGNDRDCGPDMSCEHGNTVCEYD